MPDVPETIGTRTALYWAYVIGCIAFVAGNMHGGMKAVRGMRKLEAEAADR